MVDALVSGTSVRKDVEVQVLLSAPTKKTPFWGLFSWSDCGGKNLLSVSEQRSRNEDEVR
jgi:hypothetical protein